MYLPSLVTGYWVDRIGRTRMVRLAWNLTGLFRHICLLAHRRADAPSAYQRIDGA
ncbi:hypothetical protein ACE6ED_16420 [Paenibacillus sp. CN-4]|uniref:hypothetical protein n=1 Tax=Paenibacillus nanchangensis TaxID=3348343 RepID=UPI00397D5D06